MGRQYLYHTYAWKQNQTHIWKSGVLLMAGVAYSILVRVLLRHHRQDSLLHEAIGNDLKGNLSLVAYVVAIPLAFVHEWIAMGIYFAVAAIWFIPDRRIEAHVQE